MRGNLTACTGYFGFHSRANFCDLLQHQRMSAVVYRPGFEAAQ